MGFSKAPPRRGRALPEVPDSALPPAEVEPQEVVFAPEQRHHDAVDVFMETYDIRQVQAALGCNYPAAYAFTRRQWFLEQLRKRGFVAIDPKTLGESVAVAAGTRALEMLDGDDYLPPDTVKKLGELGVKLTTVGEKSSAPTVIGNQLSLDLRGMSPDDLRDLLGGSAAEAAADVIDTTWSSK